MNEKDIEEVEESLIQLALGYTYYETKEQDGKTTKTRKHQPPNIQAITFILKNKKPDEYKEKPESKYNYEKLDIIIEAIDRMASAET